MKEDLPASPKAVEKKEEEGPGQKLICPNCEIIYDFGSSCIQCGSPLARNISPRDKEAQEARFQKSGDEKEPSQPPGPQEQKIKAPPENLICPTCKLIYESGNFCTKCGTPLLPQISTQTEGESNLSGEFEVDEKPIQTQSIQEQLVGVPHERLICPSCKIIYERGDACVRCGSPLVTETQARKRKNSRRLTLMKLKRKKPKSFNVRKLKKR
jgi:rRNA maturation endonuclease Nob1